MMGGQRVLIACYSHIVDADQIYFGDSAWLNYT